MPNGDRSDEPPTLGVFGALSALVLCCAIVAVLAFTSGREGERRNQSPASYAQAAKADAERSCVGREGTAAFECIYEKVEASQDQARGEQDLTAQQRAASSALASAFVALLTLIMTGVGVWFVKRTLDATLKAVEDTGKATLAMEEANKIAREASKGDRAWIVPIGVSVHTVTQAHIDNIFIANTLALEPQWKNAGRSPAINCAIAKGFGVFPKETPDAEQIIEVEEPTLESMCGIAGPGEPISSGMFALSEEQVASFRNGTSHVVIVAKATYYDIFSDVADISQRRVTEVRFRLIHQGGTKMDSSGRVQESVISSMIGMNYAT